MDHDRIADTPVRWGDRAVVVPEGPAVPAEEAAEVPEVQMIPGWLVSI